MAIICLKKKLSKNWIIGLNAVEVRKKIGNFMDVSDGQIWPIKGREKSGYLPWKCKMQAQSEKIVQNREYYIIIVHPVGNEQNPR